MSSPDIVNFVIILLSSPTSHSCIFPVLSIPWVARCVFCASIISQLNLLHLNVIASQQRESWWRWRLFCEKHPHVGDEKRQQDVNGQNRGGGVRFKLFQNFAETERKKRSGRMEVYRSMRVYQYLCGINGMLITFRLQGPFHILFVQSIAVILQLKFYYSFPLWFNHSVINIIIIIYVNNNLRPCHK